MQLYFQQNMNVIDWSIYYMLIILFYAKVFFIFFIHIIVFLEILKLNKDLDCV